jgi:YesN/AraC family two-component response regulator
MFGLFEKGITVEDVREVLDEVLNEGDKSAKKKIDLEETIKKLTQEKAELEFKKKMEEKEIAHLVKMKEEKILIETEKKGIDLAKKYQEKEMALQKEYFDKVMKAVNDGQKKMEEIYAKIMDRLPNISMAINKKG